MNIIIFHVSEWEKQASGSFSNTTLLSNTDLLIPNPRPFPQNQPPDSDLPDSASDSLQHVIQTQRRDLFKAYTSLCRFFRFSVHLGKIPFSHYGTWGHCDLTPICFPHLISFPSLLLLTLVSFPTPLGQVLFSTWAFVPFLFLYLLSQDLKFTNWMIMKTIS